MFYWGMAMANFKNDTRGKKFIDEAVERIRHCGRCNTFTELDVCERCASPRRDASLLCVVESPADMLMMEQTQSYAGLYYCLMGRIAPLEGVGPRELRPQRGRHEQPQCTQRQRRGRTGPRHGPASGCRACHSARAVQRTRRLSA